MNKLLVYLGVLLMVAGCSSGSKVKDEPQVSNEQTKKEYAEALKEAKAKKGLKKLQTFVSRHPRTDLADDAQYHLGLAYFEQGDFFKAHRTWMVIVDSQTKSQFENEARVGAAQSLVQLGKYEEAQRLLDNFRPDSTASKATASQGFQLLSRLRLQSGNSLGALSALISSYPFAGNPQEAATLSSRANDLVGTLNEEQLLKVVDNSDFKSVELNARFRLANFYFGQKAWGSARSQYQTIVDRFPRTEQALRAAEAISGIDSQQRVDSTVVGVILPLTGKHAPMGYKVLRGIEMGMGLYGPGGVTASTPVRLAIVDSEGSPDIARRAVDRLVSDDHVVGIVGGLLTKTSKALAQRSQELGVPAIVLSQKANITDIGNFVFRNALTAELQMTSMVDVAMKEKGWKRFAILYPNDAYGTEYATVFWDAVKERGGEIAGAQYYQPEETDFRASIKRLVGTFYMEDREAEYRMRLKEWEKKQPTKSSRAKVPTDLLPPLVDFDALFIADSPKAAGQIAPMLAYNDISKMTLLGTNIWNTPQLAERGAKYVEDALFFDSFFADDPSPQLKKFMESFQAIYGYAPDVFEAQGFDTALIMKQSLSKVSFSTSREGLRDELSKASAIEGASGLLSVSPRREVEKPLIPLTVKGGKIVKWNNGVDAKR